MTGSSIAGARGELGLSCEDDRLVLSRVGVPWLSPRKDDVEDLRIRAGEEDLLSVPRLIELELRRKLGIGEGRGVDEVRWKSGRGVLIAGDDGGSGVCDASCRERRFRLTYLLPYGALFG